MHLKCTSRHTLHRADAIQVECNDITQWTIWFGVHYRRLVFFHYDEPQDGNCPDGLTLTTVARRALRYPGRHCDRHRQSDTVSYLRRSASYADSSVEAATPRKTTLTFPNKSYLYFPLAFEALDPINRAVCEFLSFLCRRLFWFQSVTLLAPMIQAVSSATVERANSDRRSTMSQERLNALLLLFVHQDIHVDVDEVVDVFAKKHPRRIRLHNPLSDKTDWFRSFVQHRKCSACTYSLV